MNIMKNEKRKFDELRNEKRIAVMRRKFDRMEKLQDRLCDAGLLKPGIPRSACRATA